MQGAKAFDLQVPVWFSHSASHERDLYEVVDQGALPEIHLTDIREVSALRPLEEPYFVKTRMLDARFRAIQRAFAQKRHGALGELRVYRERLPIVLVPHGSGFHLGAPLLRRLNLPSGGTGDTQARLHISQEIVSRLAAATSGDNPGANGVVDLSDLFAWMRAVRRPIAEDDNDITRVRQISVQRQNEAPPDTLRIPNTTREGR